MCNSGIHSKRPPERERRGQLSATTRAVPYSLRISRHIAASSMKATRRGGKCAGRGCPSRALREKDNAPRARRTNANQELLLLVSSCATWGTNASGAPPGCSTSDNGGRRLMAVFP